MCDRNAHFYALVAVLSAANRRVLKRTVEDGVSGGKRTHARDGDAEMETTVREHVYRWFVPMRRHVCDARSLCESRWWNQPPLAAGLGFGCRHGVKNISNCQMRLRRDRLMWDDCTWAYRQRLTKKITHGGIHWKGCRAIYRDAASTASNKMFKFAEFFFCVYTFYISTPASAQLILQIMKISHQNLFQSVSALRDQSALRRKGRELLSGWNRKLLQARCCTMLTH